MEKRAIFRSKTEHERWKSLRKTSAPFMLTYHFPYGFQLLFSLRISIAHVEFAMENIAKLLRQSCLWKRGLFSAVNMNGAFDKKWEFRIREFRNSGNSRVHLKSREKNVRKLE